jgi:hypothetical protein
VCEFDVNGRKSQLNCKDTQHGCTTSEKKTFARIKYGSRIFFNEHNKKREKEKEINVIIKNSNSSFSYVISCRTK